MGSVLELKDSIRNSRRPVRVRPTKVEGNLNKKLKEARANLIKSAKELDNASRCYHGKKKAMAAIVKAVLKQYYKY